MKASYNFKMRYVPNGVPRADEYIASQRTLALFLWKNAFLN